MRVVICGGGVIGCALAYHLSLRGQASTIIERCSVACAASGKAGGFLARDWCDSYGLGALARAGFDMHIGQSKQEQFAGCDYRRLQAFAIGLEESSTHQGAAPDQAPSVTDDQQGAAEDDSVGAVPVWVDGTLQSHNSIATTDTAAQVHPYKLTHTYLRAALAAGCTLTQGIVEELEYEGTKVIGVKVSGEVIPADVVIIAMGPWSSLACDWFNLPRIRGERAHSIVMATEPGITPDALFSEYHPKRGRCRSPEVYPRPDGTVYMCGENDCEPLPLDPATITPDPDACERLHTMGGHMSRALSCAPVITTQACYLPYSVDSLPLVGAVPGRSGVYMATGHSCWGILTAPSTGRALTDLILDGKCTWIDMGPYSPARFKDGQG